MRKWFPWLCFLSILAIPDLFAAKRAVIDSVTIAGPDEHTLVIPPDYPEYTYSYSCTGTWHTEGELDEEKEEEEPEFEVEYSWSAGGCEIVGSNTGSGVTVKFRAGNSGNASVSCTYSVVCKSGAGSGGSKSASKTIYLPVWDTYHDIGMYVEGATISPGARKAVAVGESLACSVTPSSTWEYDRRQSTSITTPLDAIVSSGSPYWQCSSGSFQSSVIGPSVTWLAPETPAQGVSLKVFFDDVPYPKPENEAGTTDDAAAEAGEVIVDVVKIDRLECEEVTSKTNDPGDNETVYLPVGFNEGAVTVNAIPDPKVGWPYGKPAWSGDIQSSSGGTATVDTTTPGFKTVAAECGNIIKIKICVFGIKFANVWDRNLQHAQDSYSNYSKCIAVEWNASPSELDLKNYLNIEPNTLNFNDIKKYVSFNIEHNIFDTATIKDGCLLDYKGSDPDDANIYAFGIQLLCGDNIVDRLIVVIYSVETQPEHTAWIAQNTNEGTAWLNELPKVYSALGANNSDPEPIQCMPQRWQSVNNTLPAFYHFDATFEIRSEQTSGRHGHQACYATDGNVITGAGSLASLASSGTADFGYVYNLYPPIHINADVRPFIRAAQLDGNPVEGLANLNNPLIRIGPCLQSYYTWRPAHAETTRMPGQCIDPDTCSYH